MARIDLAVRLDSVNASARALTASAAPAIVSRPDADIPAPNIDAPDHPPE